MNYHQHQHNSLPGPSRTHGTFSNRKRCHHFTESPGLFWIVGSMDDGRRDKKRKDISGKLGKEMSDRRDE